MCHSDDVKMTLPERNDRVHTSMGPKRSGGCVDDFLKGEFGRDREAPRAFDEYPKRYKRLKCSHFNPKYKVDLGNRK